AIARADDHRHRIRVEQQAERGLALLQLGDVDAQADDARLGNRSLGRGALAHEFADPGRTAAVVREFRTRLCRTAAHAHNRRAFGFFPWPDHRQFTHAPHSHSTQIKFSDKYLKKWYLLADTRILRDPLTACFASAFRNCVAVSQLSIDRK